MTTKSVCFRNLCGGFVGGFLGILAAGLIHLAATPVGCIIGVLTGYWYDVIFENVTGRLSWGLNILKGSQVRPLIRKLYRRLGIRIRYARRKMLRNLRMTSPILHFLVKCLLWVLGLPRLLLKLLFGTPVATARTMSALVAVCVLVGILTIGYSVVPMDKWDSMYPLFGFATLVILAVRIVPAGEGKFGEEMAAIYKRCGPVGFALRAALCSGLQFLFGVTFSALVLAGLVSVIAWLIVMLLGGLIATGTINGLYTVSSKRQHLLCLSVTMTVTVTSAIVFRHLLSGINLWLVALCTGAASGGMTELIRRVTCAVIERTRLRLLVCTEREDVMDITEKHIIGPTAKFFCALWKRFEALDCISRLFNKAGRLIIRYVYLG